MNTAWPPAPVIERTTAWPSASSMSATTTFAPSRANRRAVAAPIPDAAPVTIATLSFRRMVRVLLLLCVDAASPQEAWLGHGRPAVGPGILLDCFTVPTGCAPAALPHGRPGRDEHVVSAALPPPDGINPDERRNIQPVRGGCSGAALASAGTSVGAAVGRAAGRGARTVGPPGRSLRRILPAVRFAPRPPDVVERSRGSHL